MKRTIFFTFLLAVQSVLCIGQTATVYFEKDSSSLTLQSQNKLDSLISQIKQSGQVSEIAVIGHTDADASDDYNRVLALNRTRTVADYLKRQGLTNRMHLLSKGEDQPLNENLTETEKSGNRRVEIILNYSSDNVVFQSFNERKQQFTIAPTTDTVITCQKGTSIIIDRDIFDLKNNTVPITVQVQEFYDKPSFILNHLSTMTTKNQILESQGMIYIEVLQGDEAIQLKKDKSIGVVFNDRRLDDGTNLFEGKAHNNEILWEESTTDSFKTRQLISWVVRGRRGGRRITKVWYEYVEDDLYRIESTINIKLSKENRDLEKTLPPRTSKELDVLFAAARANGEKEQYDTVQVASEELMTALVLTSSTLGWINCDRFLDYKGAKIDFVVQCEEDFTPSVSLIFMDINSVLPYSYREDNKFIFENIPIDMDVKVCGLYKRSNQSDIYFASTSATTKRGCIEQLNFEILDESEVKERMSDL